MKTARLTTSASGPVGSAFQAGDKVRPKLHAGSRDVYSVRRVTVTGSVVVIDKRGRIMRLRPHQLVGAE